MSQPTTKNPAFQGESIAPTAASSPSPAGPATVLAVSIDALPKLLNVPPEVVHAHVKAGAPVSRDGIVHLLEYAAWINLRMNNGT